MNTAMRAHGTVIALILIVCAAAFATGLPNKLLWDDNLIIVENPGVQDLRAPLQFFTPKYWHGVRADYRAMPRRGYRPVPELLFAVDYSLWGANPIGYHVVSIIVHAANCVLLYVLALRLLRNRAGAGGAAPLLPQGALAGADGAAPLLPHGALAAGFCALLFAAHPIHVEAVIWAKACSELLALLFVLGAILLYGRYLDTAPSLRCSYLGSIVAVALALMCKASAAIAPGLLALYALCFVPRHRRRRALVGVLPFVGVVVGFFALNASLPYIPDRPQIQSGSSVLTGIAALGIYLKLLLVPAGLCVHHSLHNVWSILDPIVLRALPLGAALVGGVALAARRSPVAFFALGWIIMGLTPLMLLELMGRRVGELRAYTPSVGFCLLVALLFGGIPRLASAQVSRALLQRATIALCAFLVLAYTGLSAVRCLDWRDTFRLWTDTLAKNPTSWHALLGLSDVYATKGMHKEAIDCLERLLRLDPMNRPSRYRLAAEYLEAGQPQKSIETYRWLSQEDPEDARALAALGGLYAKRGEHARAMNYFQAGLRADPRSSYAHRQLGIYYVDTRRYAEALRELNEALRLKPDSAATHHMLGAVHQAMGRLEQAVKEYQRAVELRPRSAESWLMLGDCHERLGNWEGALRAYQRCAALRGPLAEQARVRLARVAARQAGAD